MKPQTFASWNLPGFSFEYTGSSFPKYFGNSYIVFMNSMSCLVSHLTLEHETKK